jgi:SNF2 family DNA or RNA helicase
MLSWRADYCYGATGTPMGKDPMKLWPQLHVIDQGETLGSSIAMFHAAYFKAKESYWAGIEYTFDNRKRLHLHKALQHRSIRYTDTEFSDLPTLMPAIRIPVQMTAAQVRRAEELLVQAREASAAGENPPAVFIKLRQTTAGFIAVKAEDDTRLEMSFTPNPKIDALEQLIKDLAPEEKLVIFHDYVYSGMLISELLTRMKIPHAGVGRGYKDPALQLRRFMTAPTCRVFVANCAAGGTGVDGLQKVCRYAVFYESPVSPTIRKQAEKRLHRDGQKGRVRMFDLVAQGISVDLRILKNIEAGIDMFNAVVNGKEKL